MATRPDPTLGYATDIGRGSEFNQDKLGFYRPDDPRLMDLAGSIYVVADGMGTRERGAALADQAIRALVRAYYAAARDHDRGEALAVAMSAADRALRQSLAENPDAADAGVTLAAAVIRGEELVVGHVGDCRAYLVREGQAYRLTDDTGLATYLGRGVAAEPTVSDRLALGPGDRLLLCTDGLHQLVPDEQIGPVVAGSAAQEAAERLIAQANGRGGWDNITAVVVAPYATAAPAPRPVPAPVVPTATDIPWRTVALIAAPILAVAALVLLVPWGGLLEQLGGDGLLGGGPRPTVLAQATAIAVVTEPPTPAPTVAPSPTAPTVVMDLTGETADNARQYANTMGLTLREIKQYSDNVRPGFVISQSPKAGARFEPGAPLEIAISLGPPPPPTALPTRRPLPRPTFAPPSLTPAPVLATVEATATQPPPPDGGEDDRPGRPRPTNPPPPEPTNKPEPPTPKPDLPTPGSEPTDAPLQGQGSRVRGLAAPPPAAGRPAAPAPDLVERFRQLLAALGQLWRAATGPLPAEPAAPPPAARSGPRAPAQDSATPTAEGTLEVTPTGTISGTATLTVTATLTPTMTFTPTPTDTPTPTPTDTPTPTPTPTDTPTPTPTPTFTPAPAYMPHMLKEHWILCTQPWPGIDDPEPNDQPGIAVLICAQEDYHGHLYRPSGPPDLQDYYVIGLRRRGDLRVTLKVPPSGDDYDLGVYQLAADGKYRLIGRSEGAAGQDEEVVIGGLAAGRYWLQVWGQNRQIEAPYRLQWSHR